ncbi:MULTISPECIES: hypothetical protein [unclassified Streptomyces]|uniref:hypothetical protein n=1 Tax=unclassified Streptomyces TaxID=2593676 RepID=UPI0033B1180A
MSNVVFLTNTTSDDLSLTFTPYSSCTPLQKGEYWDLETTVAPSGQGSQIMWLDDNVGLQDGCNYWWDIDVTTVDGGTYLFTAQVQEYGDFSGCDKSISTKRTQQPEWNDPWITAETTGPPIRTFTVGDRNYELTYEWAVNGLGLDFQFIFVLASDWEQSGG